MEGLYSMMRLMIIFVGKKIINAITPAFKFESQLISIKLLKEEKDYYISCSFSNWAIEMIDLEKNEIKGIFMKDLFEHEIWNSIVFSPVDVFTVMCPDILPYIIQIIIFLQKFRFYKSDLS